ncbi:ISAs1 family transposase [Streptomyces sp. NPDC000941]
MAAASVLAGARSLTAITEWVGDAPVWVCRVLGFPVNPLTGAVCVPHPHTLRRLLVQLDGVALHTQHAHGTYLRERGAHYIAQVKANHPSLFDRVRRLPWPDITLDHYERIRAHHRHEIRRLKTTAFAHIDYPEARQALQVVCWRQDFTSGKLTIQRVYLITSVPPGAASGAQLAAWIRGHWKIENLLHHVRDRTFREDDSKIRIGRLPRVMAGLRRQKAIMQRTLGVGESRLAGFRTTPPCQWAWARRPSGGRCC